MDDSHSPPANTDGLLAVAAVAAKGGGSFKWPHFPTRVAEFFTGTNILSADRGGGLVAASSTSMATPTLPASPHSGLKSSAGWPMQANS